MTLTRRSLADPPAFTLARAQDVEDWRHVGALRYRALAARGDIAPNEAQTYGDWHDRAFNSQTFLLTWRGRPVGTTRSSVSSPARRWPLPSLETFANEIGSALGAESTLLEASLTAVDGTVVEARVALFHLFKAHMLRCATEGADWLVCAVPEPQIGFYRRMFNMRILSGAELCPGLAHPRVLMGLDYRGNAQLLCRRMPMLAASAEEEVAFAASGAILFAPEPSPRPSP